MKPQPRIRWCRHHQKPKPLVDKCALGVSIPEIGTRGTGGFYTLPCHDAVSDRDPRPKNLCAQRSFFTDEEVAEQDAESEARVKQAVARLEATWPLVDRIKKGKESNGRDPCPVCKDGTVVWRCDKSNKHVAMRCSTPDCIAFME